MPFVVISRSVTLGSHCSMFLYIMAWDDGEEAQRGAVVVEAAPIWLKPNAKSSENTSSERFG